MTEIKLGAVLSATYDTGDRLNIYQDTNNPALFHIYASKSVGIPDNVDKVDLIIRWEEPEENSIVSVRSVKPKEPTSDL